MSTAQDREWIVTILHVRAYSNICHFLILWSHFTKDE